MDQLPWLGKRELLFLLAFTCNYVVSVRRGLLFLWMLGMDCVILLWHSLSLPCKYNYFTVFPLRLHAASASRYAFAGRIWVSIASVPDLFILFTFKCKYEYHAGIR